MGDVVVEGYDGAGEVEGCVDGVGNVVAEGEMLGCCGDGDAVSLGEVGGVELFLLMSISDFAVNSRVLQQTSNTLPPL